MAVTNLQVWGIDTFYSPTRYAVETLDCVVTGVEFVNVIRINGPTDDGGGPVSSHTFGPYTEDDCSILICGKLSEGMSTAQIIINRTVDEASSPVSGDYTLDVFGVSGSPYTIGGDASSKRGNYVYRKVANAQGNRFYGLFSPADNTYDSWAEFATAADNGEIEAATSLLQFDVFVNGTSEPSIQVRWSFNDRGAQSLSPELIKPQVWYCAATTGGSDVINVEGMNVPNENAWYENKAGTFGYTGQYDGTYLAMYTELGSSLDAVQKVFYWGLDGKPNAIYLLLRADYAGSVAQMGQLFRVIIPIAPQSISDLSLELVADSATTGNIYESKCVVHYGETPEDALPDDGTNYAGGTDIDGEDDGRYDPDDIPDPDDFEDSDGLGFDGNAVLTKTYAVDATTLVNIGQKLWSQSYFDVLKIQNNPIENIIAVKAFPFATSGTSENIQVGDISFGVNGDKIPSVEKVNIGSCKYTGKYGNYLDLSPYTIIKINLPYIGLVQLDACDLFNATLSVDYIIDKVTGECMAKLTLDGIPYMTVSGRMGIDIPLTSSNRVQTELKAATAAFSAAGAMAGHLLGGDVGGAATTGIVSALSLAGTDYNSQRTSALSPACCSFENHKVFLLIERPICDPESAGYKHLHGYPCHKYLKLSSCSGFVQVDNRTDISIAMTETENKMLESLLKEGIYI